MSDGRHAPLPDEDEPADQPAAAGRIARYVGRPLLLAFWTLVVWGTLYAALFAFAAAAEGPSRALARATTGPDRLVGIANLTLGAFALVVWTLVGAVVWRVRRASRPTPER
jgi:hypothetical protein